MRCLAGRRGGDYVFASAGAGGDVIDTVRKAMLDHMEYDPAFSFFDLYDHVNERWSIILKTAYPLCSMINNPA